MDQGKWIDIRTRGARAMQDQRKRQLLLLVGALVLASLLALAVWQTTGTRGARRDFASARQRVLEKEKEVAEARRILNQRIAELRVVSAEADVQATKLGGTAEQSAGEVVDEPGPGVTATPASHGERPDSGRAVAADPVAGTTIGAPGVYYVRDDEGRFVPVSRP